MIVTPHPEATSPQRALMALELPIRTGGGHLARPRLRSVSLIWPRCSLLATRDHGHDPRVLPCEAEFEAARGAKLKHVT